MHGNGTRLVLRVDVIQHQAFQVPVKDDPNQFRILIDDRAAGISANNVRCVHKVQRRVRIDIVPVLEPTFRQREWRLVLVVLRMFVRAAQSRCPGQLLCAFLVSINDSECEAQCKGSVRVQSCPKHRKPGLGDFRVGLPLNFSYLLVANFPKAPRLRIDHLG